MDSELIEIIKDELNVKEVVFVDDISTLLKFRVKLNYKTLSKDKRKYIKEIEDFLASMSDEWHQKLGKIIWLKQKSSL